MPLLIRRNPRPAWFIVASAAAASCTYPATEVLVSLGTDAPPSRHFEVRVIARASADSGGAERVIMRGADAGETIGSFAVLPPAGGARNDHVTLVFEASLTAGGPSEPAQQWRRTVRFAFVDHATLSLPVFLPVYCGNHSDGCTSVASESCTVGIRCEERGLTCGDRGACVTTDVTPVIPDAGMDANVDASLPPDDCATQSPSAPTTLANFDDQTVPSNASRTVGFSSTDVGSIGIVTPGANGTTAGARVTYASTRRVTFEGANAGQYLSGGATLAPAFANAIEFDMRIPAGSPLLADATGARTMTIGALHWRPGDASVNTLRDSAMLNFANLAFSSSGADRWLHVVLTAATFAESRDFYHFLSAAAGTDELPFVPSMRAIYWDTSGLPSGTTFDLDQLRATTLPPIVRVCPSFDTRTVPASAGDVLVPVDIANPTSQMRAYRMYLSSQVTVAREDQLRAAAAATGAFVYPSIQAAHGSDGGRGAADLYEADSSGNPAGPSLTVAGGAGVSVAPGQVFHGVLVHHVSPAMLGAPMTDTYGAMSLTLRRDTLMTSLVVWDPDEPARTSPEVHHAGSNADETGGPASIGFRDVTPLPAGWTSRDIRSDQAVGTFVTVLHLTP